MTNAVGWVLTVIVVTVIVRRSLRAAGWDRFAAAHDWYEGP